MRRLLHLSLISVIAFALLSGAALLIGRQQTAAQLLTILHLTDCAAPCWIDIIPGKTTLQEARARIAAAFPASHGYMVAFDLLAGPTVQWVTLERPDDPLGVISILLDGQSDSVIDTITFNLASVYVRDRATVADFHYLFGAPLRVSLPDVTLYRPHDLALAYGNNQQGMVVFTPPDTRVRWEREVKLIVFYARGQMPLARSADFYRWRGFRTIRDYSR